MLRAERFNLRIEEDFDKFYFTLEKWWKDWEFTPMMPNLLSTNGIMVSKDNKNVCAGWLFLIEKDV